MDDKVRQMLRELRELSADLQADREREAREALTIENIIAGTYKPSNNQPTNNNEGNR